MILARFLHENTFFARSFKTTFVKNLHNFRWSRLLRILICSIEAGGELSSWNTENSALQKIFTKSCKNCMPLGNWHFSFLKSNHEIKLYSNTWEKIHCPVFPFLPTGIDISSTVYTSEIAWEKSIQSINYKPLSFDCKKQFEAHMGNFV